MLLALLVACSAPEAPPPPGPTRPDVLVISLDTTRADVIDEVTTPNLVKLRARGTWWRWAFSHAPTTAYSHASVFTGFDGHGHGVPRNGVALPAGLPTLAERFDAAGYATIGVVGASVLSTRSGLNRGFRIWNDDMDIARKARHETTADRVTVRALEEIRRPKPDMPVFAFVHYWDAHGPYQAPQPYTRRFVDPAYDGPMAGRRTDIERFASQVRGGRATPEDAAALRGLYRGEVAWVDAQIAVLLDGLRARGIAGDEDLVAVFADHGEALGEPGDFPVGHGADVDPYATHVPLILVGPGVPAGENNRHSVALSALGPTLLAIAGLDPSLGDAARLPLADAPATSKPAPIFQEATKPAEMYRREGWPNLDLERAVVLGEDVLVSTPWKGGRRLPSAPGGPVLFRRSPGFPEASAAPRADDAAVARQLGILLAEWHAKAPKGDATEDPDMGDALEALGYRE